MKARMLSAGAVALVLLCIGAAPARAQLAAALREAMAANIAAYDRGDAAGTLATIDSHSPDYAPTKQALEEQFKDGEVKAELVQFDYVGHDDEFGVARVKIKTTGKPASGFTDNITDAMVLFHMENGTWKLWSQDLLGVQILQ